MVNLYPLEVEVPNLPYFKTDMPYMVLSLSIIAQDGSYSVNLFNGDYKLVRVGNAPWERPSNDTIRITVKGNTIQDIPVTPYFFIKDVSFTKSNNKIVAKFTVNKVIANANMGRCKSLSRKRHPNR